MKLTPYKNILKYSKEKIQEVCAPIRAKQAKMQAELEMAKLDEKIVTLEQEITEICTEHPIDFDKLIDKQDEVGLLERRKKQFSKIVEELFPED